MALETGYAFILDLPIYITSSGGNTAANINYETLTMQIVEVFSVIGLGYFANTNYLIRHKFVENNSDSLDDYLNEQLKDAQYRQVSALEWLEKDIILDTRILAYNKKQLIKLVNKIFLLGLIERQNYKELENSMCDSIEKTNLSNNKLRDSNQIVRAFAKSRADLLIRVDRSKKAKASKQVGLEADELQIVKMKVIKEWKEKTANYSVKQGDKKSFFNEMLKKYPILTSREKNPNGTDYTTLYKWIA